MSPRESHNHLLSEATLTSSDFNHRRRNSRGGAKSGEAPERDQERFNQLPPDHKSLQHAAKNEQAPQAVCVRQVEIGEVV